MRIIAIVNQKGGCGKTTTAVSLAAVFARRGLRTLLVDLDPQSHCALGLGVPLERIEQGVAEALTARLDEGFDPGRYLWRVSRDLELLPSSVSLAGLDAPDGPLASMPDRDLRLQSVLEQFAPGHDLCLVDCPPTLNLLTYSVLRATREVLVPVETSYYAFRGARMQWSAIRSVIDRIRRPIACHMLPTLHRPDSRLSGDILVEMKRAFPEFLLPIEIRYHESLREAAALGMPITEYAPESSARHDYELLADWLEEHASPTATVEVQAGAAPPAPRPPIGAPATMPGGRSGDRAREVLEIMRRRTGGPVRPGTDAAPGPRPASAPAAVPGPPGGPDVPAPGRPEPVRSAPGHDVPRRPGVDAAPGGRPGERRGAGPGRDDRPTEPRDPRDPREPVDRRPGRPTRIDSPRAGYRVRGEDGGSDDPATRYGVTITSRGVLFAQPIDRGRHVAVAGDFNNWSPTRHVMLPNPEAGVLEVLVHVPPGRHRYRLVVDGRWEPDAWNEHRVHGAQGETHSLVEVHVTADVGG